MKRIIFILLTLMPLNLNAQWEIINEGYGGWINTIDFVNDSIGWIGGGGILWETLDGGESWVRLPFDQKFNKIDFLNESIGWGIKTTADSSIILKTSDGGLTWVIQQEFYHIWFESLFIVDSNNVYIFESSKIYKTVNGGIDWINVTPNLTSRNYSSLWFLNSQIGLVVGKYNNGIEDKGMILKTSNGGESWKEQIINEFNNIKDLQSISNLTLYFIAIHDSTNYFCKTEDMFENWTQETHFSYPIISCSFYNQNTIYAIVEDSITSNNIMRSEDGGSTWSKIQTMNFYGLKLSQVICKDNKIGFILGNIIPNRTLIGTLLFKLSEDQNWRIKYISYPLNDLYFLSMNVGFIMGGRCRGVHPDPQGMILSTQNSGISWDINLASEYVFRSIDFANENNGYALASMQCRYFGSQIFKTTDSGISWIKIFEDSLGNFFDGNSIICSNDSTIWSVGCYNDDVNTIYSSAILETTDGVDHWNVVWVNSSGSLYDYLRSICIKGETAWVVGDNGLIAKYNPQTDWVKQTSVTTLPLNKVFFSDKDNGWIFGGYQNENDFHTILLKTTDDGVNWVEVTSVPYLFRDIIFVDNYTGWAIGYDINGVGGILKSTDGGSTWEIDAGNLSAQLNALYIKDGYGWAVGDNGLILRTTNAGPTWVENENQTLPTEFALGQNFPNPFNPTTKIKYQIPVTNKVTLKVYDVLGREVALLVNEEKPVGEYEFQFNPASSIRNPASGVYFYQLKAGNFIQTKKMVIIK